jgi:hypothetical protein
MINDEELREELRKKLESELTKSNDNNRIYSKDENEQIVIDLIRNGCPYTIEASISKDDPKRMEVSIFPIFEYINLEFTIDEENGDIEFEEDIKCQQ